MNTSYVGLSKCFYCLEYDKILLDTRLRDSLPYDCGVIDLEPCSKCKEHMKNGVICIGATIESLNQMEEDFKKWKQKDLFIPNPYRTGHWFVMSEDWIKRSFSSQNTIDQILKLRWTFLDEKICKVIADNV